MAKSQNRPATGIQRCAIYTRKSTDEGLEQDFNSLHAQREACEAYITSQRHEGWVPLPDLYDDGGFSGGSIERPALKRLLGDIAARKIDTVVVYKVDRLTRSLADFAKIVELFDSHKVSFVAVTQQFNTTTSMGRLTLNVLLSFAQFEREVIGERTRDKIAASKKKGMWMGGPVPLGYDIIAKKMVVNETEAEQVRSIFQRYLELGCVSLLQADLRDKSVRSKIRISQSGKRSGGYVLGRGALYCLLSNPAYIGKVRHKGVCHLGQHTRIISEELWNQVQQGLAANKQGQRGRNTVTERSPLAGKLFDQNGNALTPSHAKRNGKRYRYYISKTLTTRRKGDTEVSWRLPAQYIERLVIDQIKVLLSKPSQLVKGLDRASMSVAEMKAVAECGPSEAKWIARQPQADALISSCELIKRITICDQHIEMELIVGRLEELLKCKFQTASENTFTWLVSHLGSSRRGPKSYISSTAYEATRTGNPSIIKTLVRARQWFIQLTTGEVRNVREIAEKEGLTGSFVSLNLRLAFVAPNIVHRMLVDQQDLQILPSNLIRDSYKIPAKWADQAKFFSHNTR